MNARSSSESGSPVDVRSTLMNTSRRPSDRTACIWPYRLPSSLLLRRHRLGHLAADDLSTFHHESDSLQFGDVRDRIAGDRNQIRKFPLVDRADLILPAHHLGIDDRTALNRPRRRQAAVPDEHLEVERLRPVRVGGPISSAAHHDFHSLGRGRQRYSLLKDRNHPVFAAGVLRVVVVLVVFGVSLQSWMVVQTFCDAYVL